MSTPVRVLMQTGHWVTNIGNAFVNLGVEYILRAAIPNVQLYLASAEPRSLFCRVGSKGKYTPDRLSFGPSALARNGLDMFGLAECDLIVFAGMVMCAEFVHVLREPLLKAKKAGARVMFLGAGAELYDQRERELFGKFLHELEPVAFISRDAQTFEMFRSSIDASMSGIDCAFFVKDAYQPPRIRLPDYDVLCFDSMSEPRIGSLRRNIVRAHHECNDHLPSSMFAQSQTLISDVPYDYLALYAGAKVVHTDRVHACIATLSFDNEAQLYAKTPRAHLFQTVGAEDIEKRPVKVNQTLLAEKKEVQIAFVRAQVARLFRTGANSSVRYPETVAG